MNGKRFEPVTPSAMFEATQVLLDEVFTVDEVRRAAGAPRERLEAWLTSADAAAVTDRRYFTAAEAVGLGLQLRRWNPGPNEESRDLFSTTAGARRQPALPAFASSIVHGSLLALAFLLSSMHVGTAATDVPANEPARLVFIVSPGPGGGGGGGGLRNPLPPPKVQRKTSTPRPAISVPAVTSRPVVTATKRDAAPPRPTAAAAPVVPPKPAAREPDPLPSHVLVAPVVARASDARDREGVIERGRGEADSQGPGTGGGAGSGQGTGNGEGLGSGIGEGRGGGTGGGPYRPGSGVEPPRLLREVKAIYTDEARRRSISGDVLLEIVVRADGSVGDVRLLRGLGGGLNERAMQAVRQWRFDPARRKGVPVDVVVEVAVEFMLR